MKQTTLAVALLLLSGCDSHDDDHEHGHGHEGAHEPVPPPAPEATPAPTPEAIPVEVALGDATLRLVPADQSIQLTLLDTTGAVIPPQGEARVVLTATGGEEQRVVLQPGEEGWSGPATATGASGYVAVVSLSQDGQSQTARMAWGDAPQAPTEAPEEPAHSHEESAHDHGHGH